MLTHRALLANTASVLVLRGIVSALGSAHLVVDKHFAVHAAVWVTANIVLVVREKPMHMLPCISKSWPLSTDNLLWLSSH